MACLRPRRKHSVALWPEPGHLDHRRAGRKPLGDSVEYIYPVTKAPCCRSNPEALRAYFLLQDHQGEGKWRYTMISAWWLVLAFLVGAYSGVLVMAIMSAARDVAKEPLRRAAVRAHLRRTTADAS